MTKESKFGLAVGIRVVAAIVGICVGVVTLWAQFAKPSAELGATVTYGAYRVDPWTNEQTRKLEAVLKELYNYEIQGGKLSPDLTKFANSAFKSKFPQLEFNVQYGHAKIVISDSGDLGANRIVLRIPDAIGSLVTFDNGSQKIVSGSPSLELGDLRPEQQIIVYSWFLSELVPSLDSSDISLTYDGGRGKVNVVGKHSLAYEVLSSTFMQIYLAIFLVWLLIFLWSTAYKQGWRAGKATATLPSAEDEVDHMAK